VTQKRFNVGQIVAVLNPAEAGVPLAELIWRVGISHDNYRMVGKPHVILAQAYFGVGLGITNPGCP